MLKRFLKNLLFTITVYASMQSYFAHGQNLIRNAVPEKIASGFKFSEGPLWLNGKGLILSDIQDDKVKFYDTLTKAVTAYINPSNQSNGLTLDKDGNLLLAQHKARAISKYVNGKLVPLATTFRGKKLNSPNDLVVKSSGSIYFTDPDYGIPSGQQKELPFNGVYRLSRFGKLTLLDSTLKKPNGLAFSPDEKLLYVNDTETGLMYAYDVVNDSLFANKRVFFKFTSQGTGGADGMKVDSAGYIYSTGPYGVWIIGPDKKVIDTLPIPESATNVAFGNADRRTLYITAPLNLYRAVGKKMVVTGIAGTEEVVSPLSAAYSNSNILYIPVDLPTNEDIKLEVRGINGNNVATIANEHYPSGKHLFTWNTENASAGIYLIHLTYKEKSFIQKTIISKK